MSALGFIPSIFSKGRKYLDPRLQRTEDLSPGETSEDAVDLPGAHSDSTLPPRQAKLSTPTLTDMIKDDRWSLNSDDSEDAFRWGFPVLVEDLEGKKRGMPALLDPSSPRSFISLLILNKIGLVKQKPIPENKVESYTTPFGKQEVIPMWQVEANLSNDNLNLNLRATKLIIMEGTDSCGVILGRDTISRYKKQTGNSLYVVLDAYLHGHDAKSREEPPTTLKSLHVLAKIYNVSTTSGKSEQGTSSESATGGLSSKDASMDPDNDLHKLYLRAVAPNSVLPDDPSWDNLQEELARFGISRARLQQRGIDVLRDMTPSSSRKVRTGDLDAGLSSTNSKTVEDYSASMISSQKALPKDFDPDVIAEDRWEPGSSSLADTPPITAPELSSTIANPSKAQPFDEALARDDESEDSSSDESRHSTSSYAPSLRLVMSTASSATQLSSDESVALAELVVLLRKDEILGPLYPAALQSSKIGPARFERNFSRLLKVYSKELREEANDHLHIDATLLVRRRAMYVAREIRSFFDSNGEEREPRRQNVEKVNENATYDDPDEQNFEDEAMSKDSDPDNEPGDLQSLARVKEFMVSSTAFRNLQRRFSNFVNPSLMKGKAKESTDIKDIGGPPDTSNDAATVSGEHRGEAEVTIQNIDLRGEDEIAPTFDFLSLSEPTNLRDHRKVIRFTPYVLVPRPGIVDQIKRKVELFLNCPIVWWPLQPRKVICPKGYLRLSWNCGCGAELYTDVPTKIAEEYSKRCAPITLTPSSPSSLLPMYNAGPSTSASASASGTSSQAGNANPISNLTQRSVPSQTPPPAISPSIPHQQQTNIIHTVTRSRFLHWCVDANISDTHLFHIPVANLRDASVISELRKKFSAAKGFRKYISLTDCHDVKFMRFNRTNIHHGKELIACGTEDLPPLSNSDYHYEYFDPRTQFTQSLRQSLMHHIRDSSCCSADEIQDTLEHIPKKVDGGLENKKHAEGYGILALPGLSFWKVILALALVHVGPLIFLGRWLQGHPGDLQNGTQLLFHLMMLLALLVVIPDMWSLWSVRRDKEKL
ncbi:uncharacterized protein PAC_02503 [Phialocephala subalpina]|uniref:Uncharacterized protein n=1 Tax=Phialocephala subalpina TaxID=576137 RepID=A0A1L7WIP3_9HELO|nr:uncharacterized protein PAC_02503 [Phialocephala subalpina]